jgi:hypothetical protein
MYKFYDFLEFVTDMPYDLYGFGLYDEEDEDTLKIKNSDNNIIVKPIEYEDKYRTDLLKYSKLLRKNKDIIDPETWNYLKNNILLENTPLGNVILYYEPNKDSFCYYCDRIIPYKYIDTVCRKYVIRFNCVQLYFDINNNVSTILNSENENEKDMTINNDKSVDVPNQLTTVPPTTTPPLTQNKNLFVKLKSYNKSNKPDGTTSTTTTTNIKDNMPETIRYINRYTYEGKLMNFNMLQKPQKKKFSYSDFKNKL